METAKKTARNYGIDLLRLAAMLGVVLLHVLGQGGVLAASRGVRMYLGWFLEALAYCAVNCYALISGYVGYSDTEKPYRYGKYLGLWLAAFCYSFGMTLAARLLRPERIDLQTLIHAALPVSTNHYWYFTAYTGLFFLIPVLNRTIRSLSNRELTRTALILMALFSLLGTFANSLDTDIFRLHKGYSVAWLVILYVLGAWMQRCSAAQRVSGWLALVVGLGCTLLSWAGKLFLPAWANGQVLLSYTSPTVVLAAMAWVVGFSRLHLPDWGKAAVRFFAPAAFGVYLIHTQQTAWEHLLKDAFVWIAQASVPMFLLWIPVCCVGIFLPCLLLEKLRLFLFSLAAKILPGQKH